MSRHGGVLGLDAGGETLSFAADGTLLRWTNHGDAFLGTSGASCVGGDSQCDAFDEPCTVCSSGVGPLAEPTCPEGP